MGAAIPEYFGYLDLAGRYAGGLRGDDLLVVGAFAELRGGRRARGLGPKSKRGLDG